MHNPEWLKRKYLRDGLSCPQIGKLIGHDGSTVRNWLKSIGVPIRSRGSDPASRKGWSNLDVSHCFGRTLSKATKAKIRAARLRDGRLPCMINGIHWLHVYGKTRHPRWKGGITPERQQFYASREWQSVSRKVWKRDKRTCQRCHKAHANGEPFDIHHIVSFVYKPFRCELSNLILLCEPCHYWAHSPKNKKGRFIKPCPSETKK